MEIAVLHASLPGGTREAEPFPLHEARVPLLDALLETPPRKNTREVRPGWVDCGLPVTIIQHLRETHGIGDDLDLESWLVKANQKMRVNVKVSARVYVGSFDGAFVVPQDSEFTSLMQRYTAERVGPRNTTYGSLDMYPGESVAMKRLYGRLLRPLKPRPGDDILMFAPPS